MSNYQLRLGERLRAIRNQQGLTLQQVEERSDGKWKAVVIGAYERGDRAISATKLADLAGFYGVPVTELMPETTETPVVGVDRDAPVKLDLTRLAIDAVPSALQPITRYATTIQLQRGDYNGRILTLRSDDVRALAVVYGVTVDELLDRLAGEGVLAAV